MLSLGIEASRAFWIASARAGLPSGSPPPSRAATVIARVSLVNSAPRLASTAFFLCLIDAHLEWPDMTGSSLPSAESPRPLKEHRPIADQIGAMDRLRANLDRPLHRDGDPYDDGPLPDLTSGLMWFATGFFGLVAQWLPGTFHDHVELVYALCGFALACGVVSVWLGLRGWNMPLRVRAAVTALTMPLVALALWATGGASSYLAPILLFTALFIGWFFPARLAWPLVGLFLVAYGSPLIY